MDLVFRLSAFGSVCLLCGSSLSPLPESSVFQLSALYAHATLQREVTGATGAPAASAVLAVGDAADNTPHGAAIEIAWARRPPDGLGAGTPRLELALGIAEGLSHTEADTLNGAGESVVNSSGNTRFETFWLLARIPVAKRVSLEAAVEVPFNRARDEIDYGAGDLYGNPERRDLYSYTTGVAAGARYRGPRWEGAAALRWAHTSNQNGTYFAYTNGAGSLWGFEAELVRLFGAWRGSVFGGTLRGSLLYQEGLFPAFHEETSNRPFARDWAGLAIARPIGAVTPFVSSRWVGIRTPYWDSAATLNLETLLHDEGLDYRFSPDEFFLTLGVEARLRELLTLQVAGLWRSGRESVDFLPSSTNPGSGSISVSRSGWGITAGLSASVR